jgi:hypothetical protein
VAILPIVRNAPSQLTVGFGLDEYSAILEENPWLMKPVMNAIVSPSSLVGVLFITTVLVSCGGDQPGTPTLDQRGEPTSTAEQTIEKPPPLGNVAPEVGASATLIRAAILQLSGSAIDKTLPAGPLSTQWTKVSGPGPVVFADPSMVETTATFTIAGTYVLRLTASDGQFTVMDDVTVVVQR